jgi:hypothetical protein
MWLAPVGKSAIYCLKRSCCGHVHAASAPRRMARPCTPFSCNLQPPDASRCRHPPLHCIAGVRPEQIGIITPYEGQRANVVTTMTRNGPLRWVVGPARACFFFFFFFFFFCFFCLFFCFFFCFYLWGGRPGARGSLLEQQGAGLCRGYCWSSFSSRAAARQA